MASTPRPLAALNASSPTFDALKRRLEALAAAMKGNRKFTVKKFELGAPRPKGGAGVPEELQAYSAVFDGATLEWELSGVEKTSGKLTLPTVAAVLKTKGNGAFEGGTSLVLIPGLEHGSVELVEPDAEVVVLDIESGQVKAEGLSVLSALDAAVDSLGVKGWELRYYDDFGDDDDDELFDLQGEVLDAIDRAWSALGFKAP